MDAGSELGLDHYDAADETRRERSLLPLRVLNTQVARRWACEGQHLDVQPAASAQGVAVAARTQDGRQDLRIEVCMRVEGRPVGRYGVGELAVWQEAGHAAQLAQALEVELHARV